MQNPELIKHGHERYFDGTLSSTVNPFTRALSDDVEVEPDTDFSPQLNVLEDSIGCRL